MKKKHKFSIESWYPGYSRGGFLSQMGFIESWYPRFNVKTTSYKLLWHWFWVVDLNFIEEKSWHTFSQICLWILLVDLACSIVVLSV